MISGNNDYPNIQRMSHIIKADSYFTTLIRSVKVIKLEIKVLLNVYITNHEPQYGKSDMPIIRIVSLAFDAFSNTIR
jgi:hypothetical protein